ncbi:hypothetical protein XENOCAPTIV_019126 [Xenoophorus captivus]|uniref:Uncharacterized protein n=1 Tax=Xenoophorus captivus TaxID=1517983 RepID=A0ABV0R144_9TELE
MKGQPPSEQQKELQRAKCSMKAWTLKGRRWDYRQLCRWCTDPAGRYELLNHLREAGFFVLHPPDEHELSTLKEAAALAEEAAEPAAASAEVSVTTLESGSASGSEEELGQEQDRSSGQTVLSWAGPRSLRSLNTWCASLRLSGSGPTQRRLRTARFSSRLSSPPCKTWGARMSVAKGKHSPLLLVLMSSDQNLFYSCSNEKCLFLPSFWLSCHFSPKLVVGPATTLRRCQGVIFRAEEEMQKLQKNLDQDSHVTEEQSTRYRYYCQALLILKLCLKPSVVENLTVRECLPQFSEALLCHVVHVFSRP